jgi:hypothetical protein
VFPSPLAITRAEKGKDYGLVLSERSGNTLSSVAVDGLPALMDAELVEHIAHAMPAHVTLRARFVDVSIA